MGSDIFVSDRQLQERLSGWPELKGIYAGCALTAGVDNEGNLRYDSKTYIRSSYWKRLIMLAPDKDHSGVLFGLKDDGTCVVAKDPFAGWTSQSDEYSSTAMGDAAFGYLLDDIHSFRDIVQIRVSGSLFLALDKSGRVRVRQYRWDPYLQDKNEPFFNSAKTAKKQKETIESWQDIRQILIAEEDIIIAQKNNGELVIAGSTADLFGTQSRESIDRLQEKVLIDACTYYGGESMRFAFLDEEGDLYSEYDSHDRKFIQLAGLDHTFLGLQRDGSVVSFQGVFDTEVHKWPKMRQISLGRRNLNGFDDLFLVGSCC